jgi:hypothetical protein
MRFPINIESQTGVKPLRILRSGFTSLPIICFNCLCLNDYVVRQPNNSFNPTADTTALKFL